MGHAPFSPHGARGLCGPVIGGGVLQGESWRQRGRSAYRLWLVLPDQYRSAQRLRDAPAIQARLLLRAVSFRGRLREPDARPRDGDPFCEIGAFDLPRRQLRGLVRGAGAHDRAQLPEFAPGRHDTLLGAGDPRQQHGTCGFGVSAARDPPALRTPLAPVAGIGDRRCRAGNGAVQDDLGCSGNSGSLAARVTTYLVGEGGIIAVAAWSFTGSCTVAA